MDMVFALVLTVALTNGDVEELIVGVYDNEQQCELSALEQQLNGDCFPVDRAALIMNQYMRSGGEKEGNQAVLYIQKNIRKKKD